MLIIGRAVRAFTKKYIHEQNFRAISGTGSLLNKGVNPVQHTRTRKARKPSLLRITAYLGVVRIAVDIVTGLIHAIKDALR